MSTQQHTPLPWFAVNTGTKSEPMMEIRAARIAGQPPRHCVAICATGDSPQQMESANAQLIALAVNCHDDLLAALEAEEEARRLLREYEAAGIDQRNPFTSGTLADREAAQMEKGRLGVEFRKTRAKADTLRAAALKKARGL